VAAAVRDVMAPVRVRVEPTDTLRTAAVALRDGATGLAVVELGGRQCVFTERDLLRAIGAGIDVDAESVSDHMSTSPLAVQAAATVQSACDVMIERNARHLLVFEGDELAGVLNMRDVVGVLSGAAEMGEVPPAKGS